mmetsp:Transcript_38455/g.72115  ORF Transcript_38455/g.72115 Transcript_38455/m.72115 type:complete len:127 (-) Transcript_38455:168-548(-)
MRGGYGRRSMYDDVEVDDVDDFKHGTGYQAHRETLGSYNYRGGYGYGRMRRGDSWYNGMRGGYGRDFRSGYGRRNFRDGYGYGRMRRGNSWSNGVRGGYYGRRGDRGDSWYSGRRGAERLYDGLDD